MSVRVRVRVGREQYSLPVENVREIAPLGLLSSVPGADAAVLGVRNLRGHVLPVFDLARLLGVAAGDEPTRILVADDGARRAGLAVDEVLDVGPPDQDEHAASVDVRALFDRLVRKAAR